MLVRGPWSVVRGQKSEIGPRTPEWVVLCVRPPWEGGRASLRARRVLVSGMR